MTIVAAEFEHSGTITVTNNLNLSVAGDFDYLANYLGTITTNAFNLNVGGNFTYDDSASNFTWGDNDSLVVSGDANIVAAGFANTGVVNADTVTIKVPNFVNNISNAGAVSSDSLNFILTDDFTYTSSVFYWF